MTQRDLTTQARLRSEGRRRQYRSIAAGPRDTALLERLRPTCPLEYERTEDSARLEALIPKPWGCEASAYRDDYYDVWALLITPGHCTSEHCHPRKETALVCLRGTGVVHFLGGKRPLHAGEALFIGRGAFHRTENLSDVPLELAEIEVPRNKLDLVRSADRYGRVGSGYEQQARPLEPMAPTEFIPRSRLRERPLHTGFAFAVTTGAEVANRQPLFAVSLAVSLAVQHRVALATRPAGPLSGAAYLTITPTP